MTVDWRMLADLGFSFFAVPLYQKRAAMKWERFQKSRPTAQEVDAWSRSESNVAIVTGAISGCVVLDIDTAEGEALVREKGVPRTPTVQTAKGRHIYFRHPGFEVRNFARRLTGCDLRGDGGYVIGPGSIHADGVVYTPEIGFDVPLADMPQWLLDAARKPDPAERPQQSTGERTPYVEKAIDGEMVRILRAPEGTRNDSLNESAFNLGTLVGAGLLDRGYAEGRLLSSALASGLDRPEALATIKSGLDAGELQPRQIQDRPRSDGRSRAQPARRAYAENVVPIEEGHKIRAGGALLKPIDPIHWQGTTAPDRSWLLRDWIPDNTVTLLYGEGGTGKSLLAQQVATHVALGRSFAGIEIDRRKVLAVFCEDEADELHRRQEAINRRLECDMADLEDLRFHSRPGQDNILMTFKPDGVGEWEPLFEELRREAVEFGAGLVIWDTVSDAFSGNENIRPQVRQFMSMFTRLALDIGGAVLLCAHPSVTGRATGEAGSTQWSNSARSRLFLTRPEGEGVDQAERLLSRKKANYATAEDTVELRWNDGAFVVKEKIGGEVARIIKDKAGRIFMAALARLDEMGVRVSPSPKATERYAPKKMVAMGFADGLKVGDLAKAMDRLMAEGRIREEETRHGLRIVACERDKLEA